MPFSPLHEHLKDLFFIFIFFKLHEHLKDLFFIFIFFKLHNTERFVTGPSNTQFDGVYVCSFQPGNFTGWGSEALRRLGLGQ